MQKIAEYILPPRRPPYINIKSPTAAAACLQRRVNSTAASPPAASALYLPVLGLVTTDFVSHQTPAAVSNTVNNNNMIFRKVTYGGTLLETKDTFQ